MIAEKEAQVYDLLKELSVNYERHEHPPVYTVEEANQYWEGIEGGHAKNLFLRNNKGNRHFLVVLEETKSADLKALAEKLGSGKLSFASEKRLSEHLGLETGAVSPFGLINNTDKAVVVVLDRDLSRHDKVNFHPNVNTATITVSYPDFERFIKYCGNDVVMI